MAEVLRPPTPPGGWARPLADPTAPAWLLLPEDARRNGQAALDVLSS